MIINKITIENFLCYFEKKTFNLSSGLNIILGENGEGKTKFYEAIEWMLTENIDGKMPNLIDLISAMKRKNSSIDSKFEVSVGIEVKQFNEVKNIKRSFTVTKESELSFKVSNTILTATIDKANGTRENANGEDVLEQIFPSEIRRFSMFKGEQEFKILQDKESLNILVREFSEAKEYEKYTSIIDELKEIREKILKKEGIKSKEDILKYNQINTKIDDKKKNKNGISDRLDIIIKDKDNLEEHIRRHESSVANSEKIEQLNSKIALINDRIIKERELIDDDYTKSLFDEGWILFGFKEVLEKYSKKIELFSSEKRKQETEFLVKQGIDQAAHYKLPFGVPSKDSLQEMLDEQICQVCNRPALQGSEAYNFIHSRLENYLKIERDGATNNQHRQIFPNNYLRKLDSLKITHIENLSPTKEFLKSLDQRLNNNLLKQEEVIQLQNELQDLENKKLKLLSITNESEENSQNNLRHYRKWVEDLQDRKRDIQSLVNQTNEIDAEINNLEEEINKLKKDEIPLNKNARDLYKIISLIFHDTKERKFNDFLQKLENETNEIFNNINIDSFRGSIRFNKIRKGNTNSIQVNLMEENGKFENPNDSLITSMHISILFAISKVAKTFTRDDYPMIFDAPTSTFGETKTENFLNILNAVSNQKILLIKDFITREPKTGELKIKKDFSRIKREKAFWLRIQRPFNPNDLTTINTEVEEI